MQVTGCFNVIWRIAFLLVFLAFTVPATAQSDVLGNAIVAYPIQDYLSWSTSNEIPWSIDFNEGYNDTSSLKSGPIECAGSSRIMMKIQGPATIRFEWKIDGPSGIGQLLFKVDKNKTFECPSRTWTEFNYALSANKAHEVEWCFRKIRSYPSWGGAGWIDDIESIQPIQYVNRSQKYLPKFNNTVKVNHQNNSAEINGTEILPKNISCAPDEKIIIEPLFPKDNIVQSKDALIKFKFVANSKKIIANCSLFVDDNISDKSRQVKTNNSTELALNMSSAEEGTHWWTITCCECGSRCNSSETAYFGLSRSNDTTYVDQAHPDESNFTYKDISSAISRTDDGGRVIIEQGNYEESLVIDRPLTILGRNWPSLSFPSSNGIVVRSSDVCITGLNIIGWDKGTCTAIKINDGEKDVHKVSVYNNRIANSKYAIYAQLCDRCEFIRNNISNCKGERPIGICLIKCENYNISSNRINERNSSTQQVLDCMYIDRLDKKDNNNVIKENVFGYSQNGLWIDDLREMNSEEAEKMLKENGNIFAEKSTKIVSVKQ